MSTTRLPRRWRCGRAFAARASCAPTCCSRGGATTRSSTAWSRRTCDERPGPRRIRLVNGVGIDLLEIERLEGALERRPGVRERFFTEAERAYAESRPRPMQHLAARFCAKEA